MTPQPPRTPVHVFVVLGFGLIAFASSALLIRFVNDTSDTPALAIAFWRTAAGAVLIAPFALVRSRVEMRRLTGRDWLFIGAAALLLSAHFVAWISSLYHTSVASATVLVSTSPIFLAVFGYLILGERYRWPLYGSIIIGVAGATVLALQGPTATATHPVLGNGLALGAALFMTLYLVIGRVVRQRLSFLAYLFPLYTLIALFVGVAAVLTRTPLLGLERHVYAMCLVMALGPQILGHGSFNYALRYVPAVMLGLLSLTEPVGASIGAYFLFGEQPGWGGALSMAVTLVAVALAVWFEHRSNRPERNVEPINRQI